ncbi:hypothetical protein RYX36_023283 [Vicia faba]
MCIVPTGPNALSAVLISTPILTGHGEGGTGLAAAKGVSRYDFDVDPNLDPEAHTLNLKHIYFKVCVVCWHVKSFGNGEHIRLVETTRSSIHKAEIYLLLNVFLG